ncbi:NUDIX domain-containing protein [Streptomyces goshikiensis]|uniref:NUDIX domain-containing protein n=1 Tax=Streptomyces goshikiensis TaxID=1942 RepID=UPI003666C0E1
MTTDGRMPGTPAPIMRHQAVEVFANRFGKLNNDLVVGPGGAPGSYLRWQWAQTGVVVIPVGPEGIALVPTYRYPVGAVSLEFPRGGCEPGESAEEAAARELWEEAGLAASSVRTLGLIHADTGLIETGVHVCCATVRPADGGSAQPEAMESVTPPVWVSPEEMAHWLRQGRITCGVTLAAFALATADSDALASTVRA